MILRTTLEVDNDREVQAHRVAQAHLHCILPVLLQSRLAEMLPAVGLHHESYPRSKKAILACEAAPANSSAHTLSVPRVVQRLTHASHARVRCCEFRVTLLPGDSDALTPCDAAFSVFLPSNTMGNFQTKDTLVWAGTRRAQSPCKHGKDRAWRILHP